MFNELYRSSRSCLFLLLTFSILLFSLYLRAAVYGDFSYSDNGSYITITGYTGAGGDVTIPSSINGKPVTIIGKNAFSFSSGLSGIVIPDSVTSIGSDAFGGCSSLTSVTIGAGVASIGAGAFAGASILTSITIPDTVTNIGDDLFAQCLSLTSVTIGSGVKSIGKGTFYCCSELTSIMIPNGVTSIGEAAFTNCSGLTSLTIGEGVKSIDILAFAGCSSLTDIIIPDNVLSIGDVAFDGCSKLSNVTIGNGVTGILNPTWFANCSELTSVTIGDGITGIGDCAFGGFTCLTSVSIGARVKSIGEGAFSDCSGLKSIVFPDSMKSIGVNAFAQCSSLTSIVIPDGVTSIGDYAFSYCLGLTGVSIGAGVTDIVEGTFSGCSLLTSVIIPDSVASIGNYAFSGCSKLIGAYFYGDAPSMGADVFQSCDSGFSVYFLQGEKGYTLPTWNEYPSFVPVVRKATFTAGIGGLVNPFGTSQEIVQSIFDGDNSKPVTATPIGGYHFVNWTGSGGFTSSDNPITFKNLRSDISLIANFASNTSNFTLTYNAGANGSVTGTNPQTVSHGSNGTSVIAVANIGYHFTGWSDGVMTESRTDTNITANKTVTANFAINTYTVTFDLAGKGTRTGGGALSQTVNHGSAAKAPTVTANADWVFNGWDQPLANITSNRTITAQWIVGPPVIGNPGAQKAMVGVPFMLSLTITPETSPLNLVTATGLPAGLKFDAKTLKITGVPTATGNKTVTVMAKNTNKTPAFRFFSMTVDSLSALAQGTFNGSCVVNNDSGAATMTVSAQGKITGKLSVSGKNYAFNVASYTLRDEDGSFWVSGTISVDGEELPLTLKVSNPAGINPSTLSIAEGWFSHTSEGEPSVKMYRNVWKDTGMATTLEPYIGYYTAVLPGSAEYGSGYLAITVDKAGGVKTTGKLADGTVLSLSGPLILDEAGRKFVIMYTSPTAYKGGCLFGLAEFKKLDGEGHVFLRLLDGVPFHWENCNPLSTSTGDGFARDLGLSGGWYDKIGNLCDYYQNKTLTVAADPGAADPVLTVGVNHYMSDWWDFSGIGLETVRNSLGVMTGLSAPKANLPLKVNGEWNYGAENTVGLTTGLTRATGIFKGSFKSWFDYDKTHTSRSIPYEGMLTPEREDKEDGVEGRGFFLWADKGGYVNPLGRTVTYPFNCSYDFVIQGSSTDIPVRGLDFK